MGLLDRLRGTGSPPAEAQSTAVETAEQSATRLLEEGMALEEEARLDEALQRYDAAIQLTPELARAHFNRGNILLDRGDAEHALEAYTQAVAYKPDSAAAHYNIGNAHLHLGHPEAAVTAYNRAIELKPEFADAHVALGTAQEGLGQPEAAAASYRQALAIRPDYGEVYLSLGAVLMGLGRLDEAASSYRRLLDLDPINVAALSNLGTALKALGQSDDAVVNYRRALELDPSLAEVHSNLGVVLDDLGRSKEALKSLCRALEIKPNLAEGHFNLGGVQETLGQPEAAAASYRRALEIRPDYAEAHYNLGIALRQTGQFQEATKCFRKTLEFFPTYADALMNLGILLKDLGHFDESLASLNRALELKPDFAMAHSNLLFIHNYRDDCTTAQRLVEARRFGEMVARQARASAAWQVQPGIERCLRVGVVSGDLRQHPVGNFLEGVLAALDKHASDRLTFFAYPTQHAADEVAERIKASCHGWRCVVGLSDAQLAERIRADRIDILIDLSGHTAHNRLPMFAWKPAPVQVAWLGYFATTGVAEIDYLIADPWTLPPSEECNFTEKIWRLPETRLCFTPPDAAIDVSLLPALSTGRITFGCFNNLSKMNDAVVALWSHILNAVPNSRLFLKARQLMEASVRQSIAERFAVHGVDAARLIFEDYTPRGNYLAAYQRIDIALDPFPYPGGTTTVEALWMGVPVLTLAGERFLSRQGVGLLMNAGLPEWIATDPDDYVARAVSHAGDLKRLAELRRGLRQQVLASPIFDAKRFAGHFEAALRGMWKTWCDTQTAAQPGQTKKGSHGSA